MQAAVRNCYYHDVTYVGVDGEALHARAFERVDVIAVASAAGLIRLVVDLRGVARLIGSNGGKMNLAKCQYTIYTLFLQLISLFFSLWAVVGARNRISFANACR